MIKYNHIDSIPHVEKSAQHLRVTQARDAFLKKKTLQKYILKMLLQTLSRLGRGLNKMGVHLPFRRIYQFKLTGDVVSSLPAVEVISKSVTVVYLLLVT